VKIGIIGAGVAGLAASIRLAKQGHQVVVFEKNNFPGGKLSSFSLGKYRFDAGPSLFTLPELVLELHEIANENPENFKYISKTESCRYFWDNKSSFIAKTETEKFTKEASLFFNVPENQIKRYLKNASSLYKSAGKLFLDKPLNSARTWFTPETLKTLITAGYFDLLGTLNGKNEHYFSNPKLVQLFNRYATYNGSDPYKAPGMLSMIPHLEHEIGTFIPKNGMHQITESLFGLAEKLGVTFKFGADVQEILVQQKRTKGLMVSGEKLHFDAVVSNSDVFYTYQKLLPDFKLPKRVKEAEPSSSALIFYWGINKENPALGLHNILFSNDYKAEFNHIFDKKELYNDPTVYINITSKDVPADAPKGCENWFTMINVPAHKNEDWEPLREKAKVFIAQKVEQCLGFNPLPYIEEEYFLDPITIDSRTGSYRGSLYGTSSNSPFAAFMRHQNNHSQIKGLYFVGGSVHPGGGIPLCLKSAKIVAEQIGV
jgi:diapolycopene oxygenase